MFGYSSAEEAIEQGLNAGDEHYEIMGVIQDYNHLSLKEAHIPLTYWRTHDHKADYFSLKLVNASGNLQEYKETIASVQEVWKQVFPGAVFDYFFLDQKFDQQYKTEIQFEKVFQVFTGIALFIACLGLFGLAEFSIFQRKKEMGIRKVLGASQLGIFWLLAADFLKVIVISMVLAIPLVMDCQVFP